MSKQDYKWPDIDVKALVRKHRAKASEYMRENGIDLLLLNEHDLIHTLIGQPSMKFHDAFQAVRYLVDQDFKGVFFSPFTPEPEAEYHFPTVEGIEKSISVGNDAFWWDLQVEVLVREISDRGAKRVGVDRVFPDIHFEVQRRLPDVEFVPILLDLRDMREIKFPEEIAEMEVAAKICARGHAICMEEAWIGITDGELAGIFSKYVLSQLVQYPANLYNLKGPTFETWGILGHTLNGRRQHRY